MQLPDRYDMAMRLMTLVMACMAVGYLGMFLHYSNSMCHDLLSSLGPTLHHTAIAGPAPQPMQAQLPVRRAMGM